MKLETAQAIVKSGENLGLSMWVDPSYSGRGMFGKKVAGVVYENTTELMRAVFMAGAMAEDDEVDDIAETLKGLRYDNLGDMSIVY